MKMKMKMKMMMKMMSVMSMTMTAKATMPVLAPEKDLDIWTAVGSASLVINNIINTIIMHSFD